jgi:hypothetical protein
MTRIKVPQTVRQAVTQIVTLAADFADWDADLAPLALGAKIGGSAALDHASNVRSAPDTRLTFTFVNTPETLRRSEVTAVSIREIDPQRRAGVDCCL